MVINLMCGCSSTGTGTHRQGCSDDSSPAEEGNDFRICGFDAFSKAGDHQDLRMTPGSDLKSEWTNPSPGYMRQPAGLPQLGWTINGALESFMMS